MQLHSGEITKVDPDYLIQHSIHGSPADAVRQLTELKDAGVDHFILYFWDFPNKNVMKLFASKVMPKLRQTSDRSSTPKNYRLSQTR